MKAVSHMEKAYISKLGFLPTAVKVALNDCSHNVKKEEREKKRK